VSTTHQIFLRCNATNKLVEATLRERVDGPYAKNVDKAWSSYVDAIKTAVQAPSASFEDLEHSHWSWELKVAESARLLSCPTLAIECDGETQGLMLLKTDGHFALSSGEKDRPLVYVTYLATAPWNLRSFVEQPRYSGVGTILMAAAVQMSIEAEFKGRIGLHALPQAEAFYECHGMVDFGVDADKEYLKYYELSSEGAAKFLSRRGP
jgi:hypothetical protein